MKAIGGMKVILTFASIYFSFTSGVVVVALRRLLRNYGAGRRMQKIDL